MRTAGIVVMAAIIVSFSFAMFGCAGREFAPKDPYMFWYYPKALPEADRAVEAARVAGKEKKCPEDFKDLKDLKDSAYEIYAECRDNEAIAAAKEATAKAKYLCMLEDVHFQFDSSVLDKHARQILQRNIRVLRDNPNLKVRLDGHACQHGSEHYNLALSKKRTKAVMDFLMRGGISSKRLSIVAYGKTKPLFEQEPTPQNKNSREMKANRRVHFETSI